MTGAHALVEGINGCGDCNDGNPNINPGKPDVCNNLDDDCNPATRDGEADCGGSATPDCCPSLGLCVNLQSDLNHCGGCDTRCSGPDVDRCNGGRCVCGTRDGPCPAGLNCEGGSCVCKASAAGGRCGGCCQGNTCVLFAAQNVGICGRDGSGCRSCDDGISCTDDSCSDGACRNSPRALRASCEGGAGRCSSDNPSQCCRGCIDGSGRCRDGTSVADCGAGGADCALCVASECKLASCSSGSCNPSAANAPDNVTRCDKDALSCTDEICRSGSCVQEVGSGCLISSTCVAEGGLKGATGNDSCQKCVSSLNERGWTAIDDVSCASDNLSCTNDVCRSGICSHEQVADTCQIDGACYADGQVNPDDGCQLCDPSKTVSAWSTRSCADSLTCTVNRCVAGSCDFSQIQNGFCLIGGTCYATGTSRPADECWECTASSSQTDWTVQDGKACTQGGNSGRCDSSGSCCIGCLGGGTCEAGDTDDACGVAGQVCDNCTAYHPSRSCNSTTGQCEH